MLLLCITSIVFSRPSFQSYTNTGTSTHDTRTIETIVLQSSRNRELDIHAQDDGAILELYRSKEVSSTRDRKDLKMKMKGNLRSLRFVERA